jgi:hypothetical protein
MATKRKRRASLSAKGLAAGEQFKRNKLACNDYSAWGWVGTDVTDTSGITQEHMLATCGLWRRNSLPSCPNLYVSPSSTKPVARQKEESHDATPLEDDIVVISDDEAPQCNKKLCKKNPNCLNYLGQEKWENEGRCHHSRANQYLNSKTFKDEARELFLKASNLGNNPIFDARDPNLPVGLKVRVDLASCRFPTTLNCRISGRRVMPMPSSKFVYCFITLLSNVAHTRIGVVSGSCIPHWGLSVSAIPRCGTSL